MGARCGWSRRLRTEDEDEEEEEDEDGDENGGGSVLYEIRSMRFPVALPLQSVRASDGLSPRQNNVA